MRLLLRRLYGHDYKFKCKTPCQTNKYSTRLYDKSILHSSSPVTSLSIIFDKTVEIVHTKFSIGIDTLLTGFGGSVSSGRTLLWILVSLLGLSQVRDPCMSDNHIISVICSQGIPENEELHPNDQSQKGGSKIPTRGEMISLNVSNHQMFCDIGFVN